MLPLLHNINSHDPSGRVAGICPLVPRGHPQPCCPVAKTAPGDVRRLRSPRLSRRRSKWMVVIEWIP